MLNASSLQWDLGLVPLSKQETYNDYNHKDRQLSKNQQITPSQTRNVQLILQWRIYKTLKMGHQLIGSTPIWNGTSLDQHTFLQCKFDTYIIQLGGIVFQKVNDILKAIYFNNQLRNKI
jgi:hypothetical protein